MGKEKGRGRRAASSKMGLGLWLPRRTVIIGCVRVGTAKSWCNEAWREGVCVRACRSGCTSAPPRGPLLDCGFGEAGSMMLVCCGCVVCVGFPVAKADEAKMHG